MGLREEKPEGKEMSPYHYASLHMYQWEEENAVLPGTQPSSL